MKGKENKGLVVFCIILIIAVIGLVGYITYSETTDKKDATLDIKEEEKKSIADLTIIDKLNQKYGENYLFYLNNNVDSLTDIEKVCLLNLSKDDNKDINENISDSWINGFSNKYLNKKISNILGKDTTINITNLKAWEYNCGLYATGYGYEATTNGLLLSAGGYTADCRADLIKYTKIEENDNKSILYGKAVFRDFDGILYKDSTYKTKIAEFPKSSDGPDCNIYSIDNKTMEDYLDKSYEYKITVDKSNLNLLGFEIIK